MNTNETYLEAISDVIQAGDEAQPRGFHTYELLQHTTTIDMTSPVITLLKRKLDYSFMMAEAFWILSGESELDDYVRKNLEKYSDNGKSMNGAYGPPFCAQRDYVLNKLTEDPSSRQAVITLWRPNPFPSKDIPCTIGLQFLIREGHINCNVWMRSSDIWLGLPYDIFTFSMMSLLLLLKFKTKGIDYELGTLRVTAGSKHLYQRHVDQAQEVFANGNDGDNLIIGIHRFNSPDDLMNQLECLRKQPNLTINAISQALC